jgi:xylulokinase
MSIVLGLDVGTSGTKAVAIDETGKLLASALVEYPLLTPKPDWAEQSPAEWKRAALEALTFLAKAPEVNAADVKGLGLTGQMHGSVFLDANNNVLRNAILWCDQRTAKQCDDITGKVGAKKLIEMVCNPALTGFTAPKILWLRDNEPEVYEKVRKVLLPKDYVRYELTGEFATDVADASGTLLFDVKNRAWHTELMSMLDVPADFMPKAFEGPEVTGTLSKEAAGITGLPEGMPVVAGGGDQAAGGVGCGIVRTGVISSTVGTSGVVFAFADDVCLDPEGRVHTFCHSVPGKWHVMGVVLSAGGSLRWYRDALCNEEKTLAAETGRDPYEYITEAASAVPLGSEGLLFLPYLTGERTPHKDPYAKGAFVGLSLRHEKPHMARAVLEGVAYAMRDSLEIIREMGVPIEQVRASGGGAKSPFWRQVQADVNAAPLATINVDEGPAYGAAILATVATGLYASVEEACDAIINVVDTCEPVAANTREYDKWFAEYQKAYAALAPGFRRVADLLS